MAQKEFWEIIKDDTAKTFEVIGLSTNDTGITKRTCEMIEAGRTVRCETVPSTISNLEISRKYIAIGYTPEKGLFSRLKTEFRAMTKHH